MLRTLALVLACVSLAASPAVAKKRHASARSHAHAVKKGKRAKASAHHGPTALSARLAAVDSRATLTSSSPTPSLAPAPAPRATPAPTPRPTPAPSPPAEVATPAPSPPVEHGPLGPQAGDDEVPGSRMKR